MSHPHETTDEQTLRTILAGLAMQGLLASPRDTMSTSELASRSVIYADALIAELGK